MSELILNGRELFNALQVKNATWLKVHMRVNTPIKPSNRILFEGQPGRALNIETVYRIDERNEWYELTATELLRQ